MLQVVYEKLLLSLLDFINQDDEEVEEDQDCCYSRVTLVCTGEVESGDFVGLDNLCRNYLYEKIHLECLSRLEKEIQVMSEEGLLLLVDRHEQDREVEVLESCRKVCELLDSSRPVVVVCN